MLTDTNSVYELKKNLMYASVTYRFYNFICFFHNIFNIIPSN